LTEFRECLRYGQPFFGPETLVRGAEGNIWFTSLAERSLPNIVDPASIGMVTPAGAITQIYAGVKVESKAIAAASQGGAWFAGGLEEVQRIKPPQGVVNTFHIGKLDRVRPGGSGLLTVKVPSGGTLAAKPVAIVIGEHPKTAKRIAIHAPATTAGTAVCGSPQVRVKLAGEALRRLQSSGKLQVAVAVTFTPSGGHPYTEEKVLRFQLPHHR
jgi:streptogramin lyase